VSAVVSISNLWYAYPPLKPEDAPVWVLRDLSLDVEEGEFVSIMGASGSGKTTLCLALNGIVPRSTGGTIKGQALIAGLDTKRTPVSVLARQVGLVFQEPETQFLTTSVEAEIAFGLETLGVGRAEMRERIAWALDRVGMRGHEKDSPLHLSGGQMQRVAIGAILAMLPRVLALDEPAASLDPAGRAEIFKVLDTLRAERKMTIVMVEQDSETVAEFSDRVVVIREGAKELDDTPGRVFAQAERMRKLGLDVPQVSELAACLKQRYGAEFAFTRLNEAYAALDKEMEAGARH
jgi:energy-coupling factor transport system ATP-binding protein